MLSTLRRRNRELPPQPPPPPPTSLLVSTRRSPRPALFLHLRIIVARGRVKSSAVMEDTTTIRTVIHSRLTCSRLLYSRPIRKSLLLWPPTPTPRSTVRAKLSTSTSGSPSRTLWDADDVCYLTCASAPAAPAADAADAAAPAPAVCRHVFNQQL